MCFYNIPTLLAGGDPNPLDWKTAGEIFDVLAVDDGLANGLSQLVQSVEYGCRLLHSRTVH
jgi:hypothetical protein